MPCRWAWWMAARADHDVAGGRPAGQRAVRQPLRQAGPVDEVHAVEVLAVHLADLVDRRRCSGAAAGPPPRPRYGSAAGPPRLATGAGQDHLQGDDAVQALLPCLVDDAHAAAAEFLHQLVVAEASSANGGRGDRHVLGIGHRQHLARGDCRLAIRVGGGDENGAGHGNLLSARVHRLTVNGASRRRNHHSLLRPVLPRLPFPAPLYAAAADLDPQEGSFPVPLY